MRSMRRTLRRPSLLPKSERNRAVLLRTRFTTLWKSEIHINLKFDADALKRRRRHFRVRRAMYHIGLPRQGSHLNKTLPDNINSDNGLTLSRTWNPVTKLLFTHNLDPGKAAIELAHRPVP
jgi:hypothetical protein